jgi:hypothetical protein
MPYIGHGVTNAGTFYVLDDLTMSSSTTYTLQVGGVSVTPKADNLLITLDGVIQHTPDAYTISGSTITFDTAPGTGVDFYGIIMGQSASVGQGSIGADELRVTGDGSANQVLSSDADGTMTWKDGTLSTTSATGDIIYRNASGVLAKLAIGSTGQLLTVASGLPSWATDSEPYLPLAGGTMSGAINLGSQNVTNGGTITGTFVGGITGNASTATTLATTRAINGVNFDGSAAITVTADANTLSGTTLKSTVVTSSLTSVGTIGTGVWNAGAVTSSGNVTVNGGGDCLTLNGGNATMVLVSASNDWSRIKFHPDSASASKQWLIGAHKDSPYQFLFQNALGTTLSLDGNAHNATFAGNVHSATGSFGATATSAVLSVQASGYAPFQFGGDANGGFCYNNTTSRNMAFGVNSQDDLVISNGGNVAIRGRTSLKTGESTYSTLGVHTGGTNTYGATSANHDPTAITIDFPNADQSAGFLRWRSHGSMENFYGVVQMGASDQGDFVWQGYDGSGYKEWMRLSSTGFLTKPLHPAFYANKNGTMTEQTARIEGWTLVTNVGSHFANNKFTAPVAGTYHFGLNVMSGQTSGDVQFRIYKNNALYAGSNSISEGGSWRQTVVTAIITLAVNDYVDFHGYSSSTTSTEMVYTGTYSHIDGHLIG